MTTKNQKLLTAIPMMFCPECKVSCIPVSCDGRVVVRHSDQIKEARECSNKGKIWAVAQPTVGAFEL